jgi:O-antigen/teichoic acid export membrane protein
MGRGPWALARRLAGLVRLGPFDPATDEGRSRERYRRVGLTFLATAAGRGAAAAVALVSIPVMLRYLGAERYGLWAALSSAWAALLFADLGIGNGLVSVLSEDAGRDDHESAQRHISSAFAALFAVAVVLGAFFALVLPAVSWASLFRVESATAAREAGPSVAIFIACFLTTLPLGVVTRVRLARQEGFSNSAWSAGGSFVGLGLMMAGIGAGAGLPWLVLGLSAGPPLSLLAQTAALFASRPLWLRPRWRSATWAAARRILRLGAAFSVLQLAAAAVVSSDALVAGIVLGPVEAGRLAVVIALFDLPLSLLAMLLTPLWPAYGEALARNDVRWMRTALERSLALALAFGIVVGGALFLAGAPLVRLWVGPDFVPGRTLLALMGLRLLTVALGQAVSMFLNGARMIRLQLVFAPAAAVVAVVLKVMLARRMGVAGIVAGGVAAQVLLGLLPYAVTLSRWPRSVSVAAGSRP